GGIHAAAGSLTRTDRPFYPVDILLGDQAFEAGADGFERVDDRDVFAVDVARQRRSRVEEYAGQVEARGGHEHARQALIASGQQHRAVEAFGAHDPFDGVRDDFAADQGIVHALVAQGDAVGDRDRAEFQRVSLGGVHAVFDTFG